MTDPRRAAAMLLLLALAGCGDGPERDAAARDTLSRRERDSVIGASRLPGAPVVRRGLEVADSAAARAARIDSAGR